MVNVFVPPNCTLRRMRAITVFVYCHIPQCREPSLGYKMPPEYVLEEPTGIFPDLPGATEDAQTWKCEPGRHPVARTGYHTHRRKNST